MTLAEFLLARVAEDERRLPSRGNLDSADQRRWRAECEVKRRIVGMLVIDADQHDLTLRLLALPYADHRDYDESWRP